MYTDVVTYAGATFPSQAVEAMEYVSPDYLIDLNFDGFLALGHDGGNQGEPQTSLENLVGC